METSLKRTWAEIDLSALEYNYHTLKNRVHTRFLGVVKADAYGHGAVEVSRCLERLGADYLAVSSLDEARELRAAGIVCPILILGYTPPEQVPLLLANRITQCVGDLETARAYAEKARGERLRVHIKLDTGMSRLGFVCTPDHIAAIKAVCRLPELDVEGVFTHFAVSDEPDGQDYTHAQFEMFQKTIEAVGYPFRLRHCANTGAVACYPETWLDMVRPGLLLYGYGEYAKQLGLRPVMRLKTNISVIKHYEAGTHVSYGGIFTTNRPTRMGVLPIGYADGLFRCLSNRYFVGTSEGLAPIRGKICMDMCMIDLTDLPGVQAGDEIELFGLTRPIEEMAALAGTIPYELTCAVSRRVLRVYYQDGIAVGQRLKMN